jgi:hypothetical protein
MNFERKDKNTVEGTTDTGCFITIRRSGVKGEIVFLAIDDETIPLTIADAQAIAGALGSFKEGF